jgi:hypothetical protein
VIFTPLEAQKGKSTENNIYLRDPRLSGFRQQEYPDLAQGVRLAIGCSKATRFIEGPGGVGGKAMALNIQIKKSPFYKTIPVIQMARVLLRVASPEMFHVTRPNDLDMLDSHLKGGCHCWCGVCGRYYRSGFQASPSTPTTIIPSTSASRSTACSSTTLRIRCSTTRARL